LGGCYFELLQRFGDAEQAYNQALALDEALVADFPSRPQYRGDLADTLIRLGRIKAYSNQRSQAEPLLRRAVAIGNQLVKECPDVADYQDGLATSLNLLGNVVLYAGRERPAVQLERQALRRLTRLAAAYPASPEYREHLGEVHQNLAGALRELGQLEEALGHYRQSLACWQTNATDFPTIYTYQRRVALIRTDLARVLVEVGRRDEAERVYRQALSLLEELIAKAPSLPSTWWDCQNCRKGLADLLYAIGRTTDATRLYQQIVTDYTRQSAFPSVRAHALNDLTWLLATCPDPQVRDLDRALRLAGEAARLYADDGRVVNTLGVVYYHAGQYRKAIDTLQRSRKLLHYQGDSYNTFYLAMACWQLGQKDQARCWYDQAVRWMAQHQPHGEELCRFRADAATLLGIQRGDK
jgi:tetratricopeptide (TPR) repeat protein